MKLYFSFSGELTAGARREIARVAKANVPGARTKFKGNILTLTLPQGDFRHATELLQSAWHKAGFSARELPPPVDMPGMRRGGTVRLPVFVLSLIAAVVASCMLTLALSGAFRKSPTLGTDAVSENYQGKIALIDEIFSKSSPK